MDNDWIDEDKLWAGTIYEKEFVMQEGEKKEWVVFLTGDATSQMWGKRLHKFPQVFDSRKEAAKFCVQSKLQGIRCDITDVETYKSKILDLEIEVQFLEALLEMRGDPT